MKTLTVFTPTYNRGYCLGNLYSSLLRQTSKDFEWLIVDDGSTDNTKNIVQAWIEENKISIKYLYQENQGMHGAHNTAYKNIDSEFNVCIDSDDFMPDNAVKVILRNLINLEGQYAGLVGLDADTSGAIIGTKIPEQLNECTLSSLYEKYQVKGDKKLVYKTEIVKKYPQYPLFKGERLVPLSYLYALIDQDYKLKPINEVLVIVEYQADGSTKNILKQYKKSPRGFACFRISKINLATGCIDKFKNAMHLVSCSIFAKDRSLLFKSGSSLLVLISLPFGILLNMYVRFKILSD